jgi:uncharacterized protein (DUF1800 family)
MSWDRSTAAHVYRRAGFGANRERLEQATRKGLDHTLEDLFARRTHDPLLVRGVRPLLALDDIEQLQAWWMALLLRDKAPLVERVALMWHDHFATSNDKVDDVRLMHGQVQLFREQGMGDFRELLHAVARDPAMLVWLDGNANRSGQPNENFAREVLELFALGIGNYTERDIQEAARAFSGWGVDGRSFIFRAQYHDGSVKEVLGTRAKLTGDEVIDLVLANPACARHVARKLLEEFVLPSPSPEQIGEWAKVLVQEDWHIGRTLERIFRSPLFLGPAARRARIAGPVELAAITLICLDATKVLPPAQVAQAASEMGQALYRPPSVKGWDGGRTWVHAGTWLARHNTLTAFATSHGERLDLTQGYGVIEVAGQVPDAALKVLLPDGASPRLRGILERGAAQSRDVDEALRAVTTLILTAPEYHLI